jgi:hypothetical protein
MYDTIIKNDIKEGLLTISNQAKMKIILLNPLMGNL